MHQFHVRENVSLMTSAVRHDTRLSKRSQQRSETRSSRLARGKLRPKATCWRRRLVHDTLRRWRKSRQGNDFKWSSSIRFIVTDLN